MVLLCGAHGRFQVWAEGPPSYPLDRFFVLCALLWLHLDYTLIAAVLNGLASRDHPESPWTTTFLPCPVNLYELACQGNAPLAKGTPSNNYQGHVWQLHQSIKGMAGNQTQTEPEKIIDTREPEGSPCVAVSCKSHIQEEHATNYRRLPQWFPLPCLIRNLFPYEEISPSCPY